MYPHITSSNIKASSEMSYIFLHVVYATYIVTSSFKIGNGCIPLFRNKKVGFLFY